MGYQLLAIMYIIIERWVYFKRSTIERIRGSCTRGYVKKKKKMFDEKRKYWEPNDGQSNGEYK